MNKKAVFLPLFVVVTLIILSTLTFTISQTKLHRQDKVGAKALSILKSYDEGEKDLFYLEQSSKISSDNVLNELYFNGGYSHSNSCQKIKGSDGLFILLDESCGTFNIYNNFFTGFKKELPDYLKNFYSTYEEASKPKNEEINGFWGWLANTPKIVESERGSIFNAVSTNDIQNIKITDISNNNKNLILSFSDINLKIENSLQSNYTIHPKIELENVDLDFFNKVYEFIASNCIKQKIEDCTSKLDLNFKAKTVVENNIIKVKVSNKNYTLRFAFDINGKLPNISIKGIA